MIAMTLRLLLSAASSSMTYEMLLRSNFLLL